MQRRSYDPGLAAILSFFLPGLGQIYKGEFDKALILIPATAICGWLNLRTITIGSLSGELSPWLLVLIPASLFILAWAVSDAYSADPDAPHRRQPADADPIEKWERMSESQKQRWLASVEKELAQAAETEPTGKAHK